MVPVHSNHLWNGQLSQTNRSCALPRKRGRFVPPTTSVAPQWQGGGGSRGASADRPWSTPSKNRSVSDLTLRCTPGKEKAHHNLENPLFWVLSDALVGHLSVSGKPSAFTQKVGGSNPRGLPVRFVLSKWGRSTSWDSRNIKNV
ncbi:hypothetical protein CDAR_417311 [Caerostris darwini]|uniref:Uncharacterized protein n=1 Tax=Caerostris darwini TaxID=1538125 RepID=A0AAV4X509_9ARAC|nr:hypothetical protein CDAR_417311 [Caerostris darwini]